MNLVTDRARERLAALHPEALARLDNLAGSIDETGLDPALLGLCAAAIDAQLRDRSFALSDSPTPKEAAALAFCEQFVVAVADVSDEQVAALRAHMGADEAYLFSNAVYLIEMSKRLDLTLEAALP